MNRAGLTPLAVNGFTLYEREGCSTAQWRSLKLVREPRKAGDAPPPSIATVARNFCVVLGNYRLVLPVLAVALLLRIALWSKPEWSVFQRSSMDPETRFCHSECIAWRIARWVSSIFFWSRFPATNAAIATKLYSITSKSGDG